MVKITCVNCGHNYRVREELEGKVLVCPHCRMPIRVSSAPPTEVPDEALRAEVLRLARASSPKEETPAKPPAQPAEEEARRPPPKRRAARPAATAREDRATAPAGEEQGARVGQARKDYRGIIVAAIVVLALGAGALFVLMRMKSHRASVRRERDEAAITLSKLLAAARELDEPCQEDRAVNAWEEARELAEELEQHYGGGAFRDAVAEARERIKNLTDAKQQRREAVEEMARLLAGGKEKVQQEHYKEAKQDLEGVLALANAHDCPDDHVRRMKQEASELLNTDQVQYGSKGWVQYNGEWMSPAERDELVRQARIAEMEAQGFVQFEGRWLTPQERDRLLAERQAQRERAVWLAAQQRKVQEELKRASREVVLDAGTERLRWMSERWANPVALSVEEDASDGERFVTARLNSGDKDKWVVSMLQSCDVREYDYVRVDFRTDKPVQVALGVWTLPGQALYESRPLWVQAGEQAVASFPLKGRGYKSKATGWRFGSAIEDADKVFRFSLFFYSRVEEPVRFRNVRLVREQEDGEGAQ